MREKANGTFQARFNVRAYKQVNGSHYVSDSIVALVTNPITVCLVLTLMCINPFFVSVINDVDGA